MKRCCDLGCKNIKQADEGYRVSFGFMLWACPEHADKWESFDKQNKAYEDKKATSWEKELEEFETEWDEWYDHNNPKPIPPKFQMSEVQSIEVTESIIDNLDNFIYDTGL